MPSPATRRLAVLALVPALLAACGSGSAEAELEPLTFMAGFAPQANLPFVGVYVAAANGYFDEEGLDVTIEHSAGERRAPPAARLRAPSTSPPRTPPWCCSDAPIRGSRWWPWRYSASGASRPSSPWPTPGWHSRPTGSGTGSGSRAPRLPTCSPSSTPTGWPLTKSSWSTSGSTCGCSPRARWTSTRSSSPTSRTLITRLGFDIVTWDASDYGVPTLGLTYVATEESVAERPEDAPRLPGGRPPGHRLGGGEPGRGGRDRPHPHRRRRRPRSPAVHARHRAGRPTAAR